MHARTAIGGGLAATRKTCASQEAPCIKEVSLTSNLAKVSSKVEVWQPQQSELNGMLSQADPA
eukprot:1156647-Pelagomonas_calceolata.AAC.18